MSMCASLHVNVHIPAISLEAELLPFNKGGGSQELQSFTKKCAETSGEDVNQTLEP